MKLPPCGILSFRRDEGDERLKRTLALFGTWTYRIRQIGMKEGGSRSGCEGHQNGTNCFAGTPKEYMEEHKNKKIKNTRLTGKIIIRYTLLQIPTLLLVILVLLLVKQWVEISTWIFWGIIIVKAALDVILFPFIWRAYDWDRPPEAHPMIGLKGEARDRLDPSGYVTVRGELWRAEIDGAQNPIEAGTTIQVKEIRGLTLIVESGTRGSNLYS